MSMRDYGVEFFGFRCGHYTMPEELKITEAYIKKYSPEEHKAVLLDDNGNLKPKNIDELNDLCYEEFNNNASVIIAEGIAKETGLETVTIWDEDDGDACVGIIPVYPFRNAGEEGIKTRPIDEIREIMNRHVCEFYNVKEVRYQMEYDSAVYYG